MASATSGTPDEVTDDAMGVAFTPSVPGERPPLAVQTLVIGAQTVDLLNSDVSLTQQEKLLGVQQIIGGMFKRVRGLLRGLCSEAMKTARDEGTDIWDFRDKFGDRMLSFFFGDLDPNLHELVGPLVGRSWDEAVDFWALDVQASRPAAGTSPSASAAR